MQADENLRSELEEDVKEECLKLGPVDSIKVIYSSVKRFILEKKKSETLFFGLAITSTN